MTQQYAFIALDEGRCVAIQAALGNGWKETILKWLIDEGYTVERTTVENAKERIGRDFLGEEP